MTENGPAIFLDLRDRALWRGRHEALLAEGLIVAEATGRGLRDALAEVFAPDRVAGRSPSPPPTDATLSEKEFLIWASDCALIEPISFALAEELRRAEVRKRSSPVIPQERRYPTLGPDDPTLAFSRLAAMPGTWTGPEGLRFEARRRRHLLNCFERCPPACRGRRPRRGARHNL